MFQYAAAGAGGGSSSLITMVLSFAFMFGVFYFVLIRPQKKKQQSRNQMLSTLKKGDKIVTIGGLHGTIQEITNETVVLLVNDVTKLTFERSAISHAINIS
ncbi:preprotein translocase subunit YajC [Paenibacillus turicensis]|uniref:Preprotein translocase subunit YajC n=1 Tax=Paenibacillus turicensis TaxID=160487 RepID=A0ABS4FQQ9_9BACL|nr:preprotein translocase subunit YajC [Paenibacillus turicensis]MBP1904905.1 preprotein translocase subunit YajC [Paenibacillus turicensis]